LTADPITAPSAPRPARHARLLAFDTSTDRLSIAVTDGARSWQHAGAGGAQASTTLIPAILALLADAALSLDALDAIVFGRGPGSFTGLRTSCAVAQGLAFGARRGAGLPVLPVDTLMAVAEEARAQLQADPHNEPFPGTSESEGAKPIVITALLDARMDELYGQTFAFDAAGCRPVDQAVLIRPEAFRPAPGTTLLAGNVFDVYAGRLPIPAGVPRVAAWPTAAALLRLAPGLIAAGQCVDAAGALPLYVRDKVAFTTDERARAKAAAAAAP
jgi:tRNA threonylcarbamoyladenosine biosynthesis protein TsaB